MAIHLSSDLGGQIYSQRVAGRRKGVLLPIEEAIIQIALDRHASGEPEFHGFALAEELEGRDGAQHLLGFGTLYKALARLERDGILESRWEDVEPAIVGRPKRRLYRSSGLAASALAQSSALQSRAMKVEKRWSPA